MNGPAQDRPARPTSPIQSDEIEMQAARTRYSVVAIALHWLIAAAIFVNIWVGWRMGGVTGLARFELFQLHKSIGFCVLLLSLLRFGWRFFNRPPPLPAHMTVAERHIASIVHMLFYAFMVLLPLTGWIIVSASPLNLPTLLFNAVPWPHIPFIHDLPLGTRKMIEEWLGVVHEWMAWTLFVMVALHIGAALKHHFIGRDDVLGRMLPFVRRSSTFKGL